MFRSFNVGELDAAISQYPELLSHFDCFSWIMDEQNIALQEDTSFGLFEYVNPGVYMGHFFFEVRGRAAIDLAKRMLDKMFNDHEAKVIQGLTPIENKAAKWMSRQLGFKSLGEVHHPEGTCEMFYKSSPKLEELA